MSRTVSVRDRAAAISMASGSPSRPAAQVGDDVGVLLGHGRPGLRGPVEEERHGGERPRVGVRDRGHGQGRERDQGLAGQLEG